MVIYAHSWVLILKEENIMFKLNVGSIDRILRIVVGLGLILATSFGLIGVWGWIGVIPLVTGLFQFCPLYRILGLNTCKLK